MNQDIHIDSLDKKILAILRENARKPYLEVGRECNVSGAAIHQRVNKLSKEGVISGTKLHIEPKKLGYQTCAYVGIFLNNASYFDNVLSIFKKIPEITQCHYTTGEYSLFIKVYAKNNEHLKTVLTDKLQSIDGISRTVTFISLEALIDREVPIE